MHESGGRQEYADMAEAIADSPYPLLIASITPLNVSRDRSPL